MLNNRILLRGHSKNLFQVKVQNIIFLERPNIGTKFAECLRMIGLMNFMRAKQLFCAYFVSTLVTFAFTEPSLSAPCTTAIGYRQVQVLKQIHYAPALEAKPEFLILMRLIAHSQFNIAKTLLETPNAEIFMEGLATQAFTPEIYKNLGSKIKHVHNLFPSGIPASFEDLNAEQKYFLAKKGAAPTLWYLGKIPRIHPVIDAKEAEEIRQGYILRKASHETFESAEKDVELQKLIFSQREKAAEKKILDFMDTSAYDGQPLILIFGAAHHFPRFEK